MIKDTFQSNLQKLVPDYSKRRFIFAVSGGPDSVAMLYLAKACRLDGLVAHCHFHLRGQESDEEAGFVQSMAENLGYDFFIEHFDTRSYASQNKISVQMAARDLRYGWFHALMNEHKADLIMLGHNRDDVAETMLINQLRGTGLRGLTGMPEKTPSLVRPMLDISRDDILALLELQQIPWRQDSSNDETKYIRNKIRHDVLPILDTIKSNVRAVFRDNASRLQRSRLALELLLDHYRRQHFDAVENGIRIPKSGEISEPALLFELIRDYGFTYDAVDDLCVSSTGGRIESDRYVLTNERDAYVLLEKDADTDGEIVSFEQKVFDINQPLKLRALLENRKNVKLTADENIAQIDADKLHLPLKLRKWQEGDRFMPLGMQKFQKLSDFFVNQKMGYSEKQAQWLLCSGQKIVWVVGRRIDDRFKITDATENVCVISYRP